jgi:hypothetical protein
MEQQTRSQNASFCNLRDFRAGRVGDWKSLASEPKPRRKRKGSKGTAERTNEEQEKEKGSNGNPEVFFSIQNPEVFLNFFSRGFQGFSVLGQTIQLM